MTQNKSKPQIIFQSSTDRIFLDIARKISTLSTCVSWNVGSVIVKDGQILMSGSNGTPKGFLNCQSRFEKPEDFRDWDRREEHHEFSEKFEIHSEIQCLQTLASNGVSLEGATLYCTLQPCSHCLKELCGTGITRIVYEDRYDKNDYTDMTFEMLKACNIELQAFEDISVPGVIQ